MGIQLQPVMIIHKYGHSNKMSVSNRKVADLPDLKHPAYRKINTILNCFYDMKWIIHYTFLLPQQTASEALKLLNYRNRWFSHTAISAVQWLRLAIMAAWIRTQARSCGICGGQSDSGESFLREFRFSFTIIPLTAPHSLITYHQALSILDTCSTVK
jgi:hypothetical protein